MPPFLALSRKLTFVLTVTLAALASMAAPQAAASDATLTVDRIKVRGAVRCGGVERPGLGETDSTGRWQGIEVDLCRALAFVVLGSQDKVNFRVYVSHADYDRVRRNDDDLFFLSGREIAANQLADSLVPGPTVYIASVGLMVPGDAAEHHVGDLAGKSICFHSGDTAESSLEQAFDSMDAGWLRHPYSEIGEMNDAYAVQRCHAVAGETTELAHTQLYTGPAKLRGRILPEPLNVFPIIASTGVQDARWTALVNWVFGTLVVADRPERKWFAGGARAMPIAAPGLGLATGWQDKLIKAVGSYGDIYERDVGERSPYRLDRGLNANQLQGGLLLAPFVD